MSATAGLPLLLLGSGVGAYRDYALEGICQVHPVILLDHRHTPWADRFVVDQMTVDLSDRSAVGRAAGSVAGRWGGIAGVLTYAEDAVEQAASLAEDLGLPGPSRAAVTACRDKARTRELLDAAFVRSARYRLPDTDGDAVRAAVELGFPVVVKPRGQAGSLGVRRADTDAQVREAFQDACTARLPGLAGAAGVLIEEYLPAPEVSAECAVLPDGTVVIVGVTRKNLGPEPRFEEVAHSVDAADELLADPDLRDVVTAGLAAVGFGAGVAHVELRHPERGWTIVEINARQGGDLIPYLLELATGVSLPQVAAALATGRPPRLEPSRSQAAAIRFHYPVSSGRIIDLHGAPEPRPEWLQREVWLREPGQWVQGADTGSSVFDRLGYTVVTGRDAARCRQRLELASTAATIRIDPPVHDGVCVF